MAFLGFGCVWSCVFDDSPGYVVVSLIVFQCPYVFAKFCCVSFLFMSEGIFVVIESLFKGGCCQSNVRFDCSVVAGSVCGGCVVAVGGGGGVVAVVAGVFIMSCVAVVVVSGVVVAAVVVVAVVIGVVAAVVVAVVIGVVVVVVVVVVTAVIGVVTAVIGVVTAVVVVVAACRGRSGGGRASVVVWAGSSHCCFVDYVLCQAVIVEWAVLLLLAVAVVCGAVCRRVCLV